MGKNDKQNSLTWAQGLRSDFLPSIVVFLVALPLCLGIAIASGAPPVAGLITGIVGGLVVGWIAGSPLQVSGPAAGLTVIVVGLFQTFNVAEEPQNYQFLMLCVSVAGLMQLAAGALKLGQWFRAVSPAVIYGMLAGIGVLIFSSQFHVMADDEPRKGMELWGIHLEGGLANLVTIPHTLWKVFDPWDGDVPHHWAAGLGVFTIAVIVLWKSFAPKNLKVIPGPLLGVLLATIILMFAPAIETAWHGEDTASTLQEVKKLNLGFDTARLGQVAKAIGALSPENMKELDTDEATRAQLEKLKQEFDEASKTDLDPVAAASVVNSLEDLSKEAHKPTSEKLEKLKQEFDDVTQAGERAAVVSVSKSLENLPRSSIEPIVAALNSIPDSSRPELVDEIAPPKESFFAALQTPNLSVWPSAPWRTIFLSAIGLALVASAETLLCATAVDQMHKGERTKYDRELFAQGVGNTICGMLGGLPMTGVIVRSSANVEAGAKTRLSAVMHGMWLLLFVAFLPFLLELIPKSSLAAVLVYTGYKLVNPQAIKKLWSYGKSEVAIYFATLIMIVSTDLLMGVATGIVLAAIKLLYTFANLDIEREDDPANNRTTLTLNGTATFIRLPKLAAALEQVPDNAELHVNFEHLEYIDHACLDLLVNWEKQHEATGGSLVIDWESLTARFRGPNERRANGARTKATATGNDTEKQGRDEPTLASKD